MLLYKLLTLLLFHSTSYIHIIHAAAPTRYDLSKSQYYYYDYNDGCTAEFIHRFKPDMVTDSIEWMKLVNINFDKCSTGPAKYHFALPEIGKNVHIVNVPRLDENCVYTTSTGNGLYKYNLNNQTLGFFGFDIVPDYLKNEYNDTMHFHFNLPNPHKLNTYSPAFADVYHGHTYYHTNINLVDIAQTVIHEVGHLLGFSHTLNGKEPGAYVPNPMIVANWSYCYVTPQMHGVFMTKPNWVYSLSELVETLKDSGESIDIPYSLIEREYTMLITDNEDIFINIRDYAEFPSAYKSNFRTTYACNLLDGSRVYDCDFDRFENQLKSRIELTYENTYIYEFIQPKSNINIEDVYINNSKYNIYLSYVNTGLIKLRINK